LSYSHHALGQRLAQEKGSPAPAFTAAA